MICKWLQDLILYLRHNPKTSHASKNTTIYSTSSRKAGLRFINLLETLTWWLVAVVVGLLIGQLH